MPSFDEQYRTANPLEEVFPNIIKGKTVSPCSVCGKLTKFLEINFEGYFCSHECVSAMWKEYEEHSRAGEPDDV